MNVVASPGKVIPNKPKVPNLPDNEVLASITTGRIMRPRKCFLYGVPGIGKTTWAANAWSPVFVPTEEGTNDLDVPRFPLARTYGDVTKHLRTLASGNHEFKTVVLDSADWLEAIIHRMVADKAGVESVGDIGYGRGYAQSLDAWGEVTELLNACRDVGLMVILLGHCEVFEFKDPQADPYSRYQPKMRPKVFAHLVEFADEVFFAYYQADLRDTGAKKPGGESIKRAVGGRRLVRTQERPAAMAKNRLGMPELIDLDFSIYADAIKRGPPNG